MVRHLEMVRLNEILEEDLRNLKETDVMGPMTRMEFNLRKQSAGSVNDEPKFIDVMCPGLLETDFCDCDSDCDHSPEFCACPEARVCCDSYHDEKNVNIVTITPNPKFAMFDKTLNKKKLERMKAVQKSW